MDFNRLITQFKEPGGCPEIRKEYNFVIGPTFEFPLKKYTTDTCIQRTPNSIDQIFSKDGELFLETLELSCTGKGLDELSTKYYSLGSDIVNRLDRYQRSAPLHYACMNGFIPIVRFLLDHGADVDILDGSGKVTPLMCAAAHGHLEIVNLVLEHGCNVDAGLNEKHQGGNALIWAVRGNKPEVVQCLLKNSSCQNSTILYSETPIHAAIKTGSVRILDMLISHNEVNRVDFQMGPRKDTPLHLAARGKCPNSLEICKLLLEKGNSSVNAVNASRKTALHLAAAADNPEVTGLLLSYWASADAQDKDGRTPLFQTISDSTDSLKTLEVLISRGKCNVNHQDLFGYTALHLAAHREVAGAVQILLMGGADFSLKSTGGVSALSMLHRKIPNISAILYKVFDQAVTVTRGGNRNDLLELASNISELCRQDCKVKVNFKCLLPSQPVSNFTCRGDPDKNENRKRLNLAHPEAANDEDERGGLVLVRKETAKLKCLVDEGLTSLLLHPVVHAFLDMKWHIARPIFLPAILLKLIFVLMFSVYAEMPHWMQRNSFGAPAEINGSPTYSSPMTSMGVSGWCPVMYIPLVTMVTFKAIIELTQILRAPKSEWRSLEHWLSLWVFLTVIINMRPLSWGLKHDYPLQRSMAALGVLLAWIDVWISMSRFPKLGLSIRIFFQVLKNFSSFILPHCCLLIGFVLSLTLLLPENTEFEEIPLTIMKLVRIMAGDITIADEGKVDNMFSNRREEVVAYFLLIFIYTAFVLLVAIVLMNLLIGLAVNDLQGIYAEASVNKLVKQTILLNTLESNFQGRFIQKFLPKRFKTNFINLFQTGLQSKELVFMPFDPRDQKVSAELTQALLNVNTTAGTLSSSLNNINHDSSFFTADNKLSHISEPRRRNTLASLTSKDKDQGILMEKISELVANFLAERNPSTSTTSTECFSI